MRNRRMTRNQRRRKLLEQRLMGIGILVLAAVVLWMCHGGQTPEEQDATAVVLMVPLGLWMLLTKKIVIY